MADNKSMAEELDAAIYNYVPKAKEPMGMALDAAIKDLSGPAFLPAVNEEEQSNEAQVDFGTSLDLNKRQRSSQRSAQSSYRDSKRRMEKQGHGEDFDKFIEQEGEVGLFEDINYAAQTVLTPTFDLLQSGNFAMAGGVSEYLKTGSVVDGFMQAGVEFADALPFIEVDGARKPTFQTVFDENEVSFWGAPVVALALDMIVDPINLVPGGAIAKFAKKGGGAAIDNSGVIGRAFERMFDPTRQIEKLGQGGADVLTSFERAEAGIAKDYLGIENKVDRLVANMTESEKILFGLYMDQPGKLKSELAKLVTVGALPANVVPEMQKRIDHISRFTGAIFRREASHGILDMSMFRDNYVAGMLALDPKTQRSFGQFIKQRTGGGGGLPVGKTPSFGRPRKTANQEERLRMILADEIGAKSTELNIERILLGRGLEHARFVNTRKFMKGIVENGSLLPDGTPFSQIIPKTLFKTEKKLQKFKDELAASGSDKDVLEVIRKVRNKKGVTENVIDGAYLLPKVVVDYVKKSEKVMSNDDDLGKFFEYAEKLTSVWRGLATLSPGFHNRNYLGMLWTNHMAGVGSKVVTNLSKFGLGDNAITVPSGGGFALRHLEAMKLQVMTNGAGKLPSHLKTAMDAASQHIGFGDFKSVPFPDIMVEGKMYDAAGIMRLAQEHDVPQSVTKISGLAEEATKVAFRDQGKTIPLSQLRGAGVNPLTEAAFTIEANKRSSLSEVTDRVVGNGSPQLQANRAIATIPENNGRLALFIDRLMKGDSPDIAAKATKTWHFDYRKLSNIEKQIFAQALPFYAWMRFSTPRMVMALLENPGRVAKTPKLKRALEEYNKRNGSPQDLPVPDYYEETQAFQLPAMYKDNYPLFAQLDLPLMQLNQLNTADLGGSIHPFGKLLIETATGQNLFLDTPIEKFPGEVSEDLALGGINISKESRHVIGTLLPPVERYVFRPTEQRQRQRLDIEAVRQSGITFRALDVRRVLRGKDYQNAALARAFEKKIKQDAEIARKKALR